MSINDYYLELKQRLNAIGVMDPAYEARFIIEEILNISWSDIVLGVDFSLSPQQSSRIDQIVTERSLKKPLSRVFQKREFWGMEFNLNEATLDPRPDTELLVEKVLSYIADKKQKIDLLDLGTGTGCIPITILTEHANAQATAVDLSDRALQAAKENAKKHNIYEKMEFIESDWFENVSGEFDVITSNPPYIDSNVCTNLDAEVKNHDPILALDGGENGLIPYEIIFSQIKKHLKPTGRAFLEIGYDQCGYIQGIANKYRIRIHDIHYDYAGNPRVVEISCGDK